MSIWTDVAGRIWERTDCGVATQTTTGVREFTDVGGTVLARTPQGNWAPVAWCRFTNNARIALEALS